MISGEMFDAIQRDILERCMNGLNFLEIEGAYRTEFRRAVPEAIHKLTESEYLSMVEAKSEEFFRGFTIYRTTARGRMRIAELNKKERHTTLLPNGLREKRAIALFIENPSISSKELAAKVGITDRQLRNYGELKRIRSIERSKAIRK